MAEVINLPAHMQHTQLSTKPYWLGVSDLSPRFDFTVGGLAFPRISEIVTDAPGGGIIPIRTRTMGCIAYLVPHQVERIQQNAYELVVRMQGTGPKSKRIVLNSKSEEWHKQLEKMVSTYRPDATDHPVASYIYMLPWEEKAQYCVGAEFTRMPPTMAPLRADILQRLKLVIHREKTPEEKHAELIEQAANHPEILARMAAEAGQDPERENSGFPNLGGMS